MIQIEEISVILDCSAGILFGSTIFNNLLIHFGILFRYFVNFPVTGFDSSLC